MITTAGGDKFSEKYLSNYIRSLVHCFYKILPMREENEESLPVYMTSLRRELVGFGNFLPPLANETMYISLLCTLQSMIDTPDADVAIVKRDVFKAINICKNLSEKILNMAETDTDNNVSENNTSGGD